MNKRFLEKYEEEETNQILKFYTKLGEGKWKFSSEETYPPTNRLKLKYPYAKSLVYRKIWPLIPLYGSVVIELSPIPEKKQFEEFHGFDIEDIPRLIKFAQETEKIQFTIHGRPTNFKDIDFLEPILKELNPPMMITSVIAQRDINKDEIQKTSWLFSKSGFSSFLISWDEEIKQRSGYGASFMEGIATSWLAPRIYNNLKHLGLIEMASPIKALIKNKQFILALIALIGVHYLLLEHSLDPLKPSVKTLDRKVATFYHQIITSVSGIESPDTKFEFPYEIGTFLNNRLKLIVPKNINGVVELNNFYDQNDLRKVMTALDLALKQEEIGLIKEKTEEIPLILSKIWNKVNKTKKKEKLFEKYGISLGIAAIGTIVTLPYSGLGGLIAGLGFTIMDKMFGGDISEKITKKLFSRASPNYIMNIYDFKEQHRLFD